MTGRRHVGGAAALLVAAILAIAAVSGVAASQSTTGNASDGEVVGRITGDVDVVEYGLDGQQFHAVIDSTKDTKIGLVECNIPQGQDGSCRGGFKPISDGETRIEFKTRVTQGTARVCMMPAEGVAAGDFGFCPVAGAGGLDVPAPNPWQAVALVWLVLGIYMGGVAWYETRGRGRVAVEEVEPDT